MEVLSFRDLFKRALHEKYGTIENMELLEQKMAHLRTGISITYEDMLVIADESFWPFRKFWSWPKKESIEKELFSTGPLLSRINEDYSKYEKEVITKLNQIFKNISLVSILLRFIFPEYYGIYSTPVLHISGTLRGRDKVEDYLNYIKNLRDILNIIEIREHYHIERVADVDMLLLALAKLGDDHLEEFNSLYMNLYVPDFSYSLVISPNFSKSITKEFSYDKEIKGKILDALIHLSKKPNQWLGDTIKQLKGYKEDLWRYRIGKYRLIYIPKLQKRSVVLIGFGQRDNIYDWLDRRFK